MKKDCSIIFQRKNFLLIYSKSAKWKTEHVNEKRRIDVTTALNRKPLQNSDMKSQKAMRRTLICLLLTLAFSEKVCEGKLKGGRSDLGDYTFQK